jgi:acyl-CoA synthetase (NDP forming)
MVTMVGMAIIRNRDLRTLFDPASIAVVGASADASKWGGDVAARLARGELRRRLFFVNRKGGQVCGRQAFRSLRALPETPEMVILAVPAAAFEDAVDDAVAVGARAVVGIFAGLGETGDDGRVRERVAAAKLRAAGALLVGPNCMGVADTSTGLQAVAYLDIPAGGIAFVSQSGGLGEELVTRAKEYGVGFSRYVTLGNQADVGIAEVLGALTDHEPTRVVAVYAEDLRDGRRLARVAQVLGAAGKPVILLSPGRSEASARSAHSHTGSLAPDAAVLDAVCETAGVLRVATPGELFETAVALLPGRVAKGRRVAVVSDGGGHGGVAADAAGAAGLTVQPLSEELLGRVREALPVSVGTNPIDFALGTINPDAYGTVVEALAGAGEVDCVLAVGQFGYWGARFDEFADYVAMEEESAHRMAAAARASGVPVVACTAYPGSPAVVTLRAEGVPVFREIGSAVGAVGHVVAVGEFRRGLRSSAGGDLFIRRVPAPVPEAERLTAADYWSSREALAAAGVPFAAARLVHDWGEAATAAAQLGYPVALKALGLLHKSDAGGVALSLADEAALRGAYDAMTAAPAPAAFSVESMAPLGDGVEVIVGCRYDRNFGPVLLVGLGGAFAELLDDVRLALAPVTEEHAAALFKGLRGAQVLQGARGRPALDLRAAARAAAALSRFAAAHPEVAEVEVNPLLVLPRGVLGLDARIVLAETGATTTGG